MGLSVGVSKVDITPEKPVPLAGYVRKGPVFADVVLPLHARVFYFRDEAGSDCLLIAADLLWWGTDQMPELYRMIRQRWGIPPERVILNASHTHSGPQTSAHFPRIGKVDPDYLEYLAQKVAEAIEQAAATLEPVRVERGTGACAIGINRRKWVDGKMAMKPNPDGPTEPEVNVIRFIRDDGSPKAVLVHYTCHPTTTSHNNINAEYPGVAMALVEEQLGEGSVAGFLQGCCGDIRPALVRDGGFYGGSEDEVRELGERLGSEVLRVLNAPMRTVAASPISGRRIVTPLRLGQLPDIDTLHRLAADETQERWSAWARLLLEEPERVSPTRDLEMTRMDVADGLSFLSINGEAVLEYGLTVKSASGGKVLPVAYSNGMIGYLPTRRQVEEGGYEAHDFIVGFGMPAPFLAELEDTIRDRMALLLQDDSR